ncbi:Metallo-beta-lactamase superfamily protein [Poriferisphaera corsica]|uniref:Metallo-beta-lactamase domain-containing protein 1 n=1 Tax=Poriferisphaera corsica TaxID=2528020 RepID=A0A517YUV5_9BACT|nr:MBL fold metallo-hydrolase [Poriferisphaera corsica]QDU33980.1 Metallo-beta-lactamase superfamily protein [Poriferisphaera corsica]
MDYRIISIGTLSTHELWDHPTPPRTAHATTTLIRSGDRTILVDPGLPPQIITARLSERTGLTPDDITDVFLTNFRPSHRMGLSAFEQAKWFISERERETIGPALIEQYQNTEDEDVQQLLQYEVSLLKKCDAAPDTLAPQVDLFPCPGFTPGTCGLLLLETNTTTLIAGDAVATAEHFEQGRILRGANDIELAQESFIEAVEIADVIVPGHDNLIINKSKNRF